MRKFLWIVFLSLLFVSKADSQTPIAIINSATNKSISAQGDGLGTQYTTERYPISSQFSTVTLLTGPAIAKDASVTSASIPNANLYGFKGLRVRTDIAAQIRIEFIGSFDGVNFGQIMNQLPITSGGHSMNDTLYYKTVVPTTPGANIYINLSYANGAPVPYPYIQVKFTNIGTSSSVTPTVEFYGRVF